MSAFCGSSEAPTDAHGLQPGNVHHLHCLVLDGQLSRYKLGTETSGIATAAFGVFVRRGVQKWDKVVRDAGVVID